MKSLGWFTEFFFGEDNREYVVIKDYNISIGHLKDCKCDVAFMSSSSVPYVFPPAIHTKPALLPMNMNNAKIKTKASPIGAGWQYWSRRLNKKHTPKNIVAHIATIFRDVKNE